MLREGDRGGWRGLTALNGGHENKNTMNTMRESWVNLLSMLLIQNANWNCS